MPRSNYIYIVVDQCGEFHGFTVKHEMISALRPNTIAVDFVVRVRDNQSGFGERLDVCEWSADDPTDD